MKSKKEKMTEAKTLVVQGATLKRASKKTGLSIDIIKKCSAREKWLELQEDFLKEITAKMIKERGTIFLQNRLKLFDDLGNIYKQVIQEIEHEPDGKKIKIYNDTVDILKKCISGQSELLGTLNMKELYIEQSKIRESTEKEDSKDRTLNIRVIDGLTCKTYNENNEEIEEGETEE